MPLKLGCPEARVLNFDPVDQVNAKVQMDGLVAQNILELLANARHEITAVEGEDHGEAAVEEDALHDHVVANEVVQELLGLFWLGSRESGIEERVGQLHLKGILALDGGDAVVHGEDLALVQAQALDDIEEGVGM